MPWFPLDTHYLADPKVQHAGDLTPFALSVFPALLAQAKQRANGGWVEVTYRDLAHSLFISTEEAEKAVAALISTGILTLEPETVATCPDLSPHVRVRFPAWRRWNQTFRKAQQREAKSP